MRINLLIGSNDCFIISQMSWGLLGITPITLSQIRACLCCIKGTTFMKWRIKKRPTFNTFWSTNQNNNLLKWFPAQTAQFMVQTLHAQFVVRYLEIRYAVISNESDEWNGK